MYAFYVHSYPHCSERIWFLIEYLFLIFKILLHGDFYCFKNLYILFLLIFFLFEFTKIRRCYVLFFTICTFFLNMRAFFFKFLACFTVMFWRMMILCTYFIFSSSSAEICFVSPQLTVWTLIIIFNFEFNIFECF